MTSKEPTATAVPVASDDTVEEAVAEAVPTTDEEPAPAPDDTPSAPPEPELTRLQRESSAMMRLLRQLSKEESELRAQNAILAREALLCGFDIALVEPPAPKRRKSVAKKSEPGQ